MPINYGGQRRPARRDFGYGDLMLDRGQVVELIGAVNDERLVRLGYFGDEITKKTEIFTCGKCGAEFIDSGSRTHHGDRHHRRLNLNPYQEDDMAEKREAMLNEVAPIDFKQTIASQKG